MVVTRQEDDESTTLLRHNPYSESSDSSLNNASTSNSTTLSSNSSQSPTSKTESAYLLDHKQKFKKSLSNRFLPVRFLPTSYYILYFLLTSMQELPMASIQWLLSKETKFSPAELTTYYNLCFLPWVIKPLWGFIADNVSICGYRRKPYLIFFAVLSCAVFILMSFFCQIKSWMRVFGILQAWCVAFCEVQVDGLVVTLANALVRYQTALYIKYPEFKPQKTLKEASTLLTIQDKIDTDAILNENPLYVEEITPAEFDLLLTHAPKASIQSEAMTIRTTASLISSLISILLHLFLNPRHVVAISSTLPIIIILCISWVPENYDSFLPTTLQSKDKPSSITDELLQQADELHVQDTAVQEPKTQQTKKTKQASEIDDDDDEQAKLTCCAKFKERFWAVLNAMLILWKPLIFMLAVRSMPTSIDPVMSYIFGQLELPPWLLSGYSFITVGAGLLSTLIYWKWFTKFSVIISLIIFTILSAIATLPTACLTAQCNTHWFHLPDWAMVFVVAAIGSFVGRFALMPTLVLAAETVPPKLKLEATMFSIYTAMNNVGNLVSYSLSMSMIYYFDITYEDYSRLHEMVIVCAVCSVFPLIFVPLIYCTQKEIKQQEYEIAQADLVKLEEQKRLERERNLQDQPRPSDNLFLYMNEDNGQLQLTDPHHVEGNLLR